MGVFQNGFDGVFGGRAQEPDGIGQVEFLDEGFQVFVVACAALFVFSGDVQGGGNALLTEEGDRGDQVGVSFAGVESAAAKDAAGGVSVPGLIGLGSLEDGDVYTHWGDRDFPR